MADPVDNPAVVDSEFEMQASSDKPSAVPPVVTDRLTKYYGGTPVVNGLNLKIEEG